MYDYSKLTWSYGHFGNDCFDKSSTLLWVILSSMESCAPKKHVRLQSLVEKNTKTLSASKRFRPTLKNLKDKMCIYLLQDKKMPHPISRIQCASMNTKIYIGKIQIPCPGYQKNTWRNLNILSGGLLAHQLAFLQHLDLTALKGHLNLRNAFILEVHIDASCRKKSQRPNTSKMLACNWDISIQPSFVSKQVLFFQFLNFATSRSASSTQRAKVQPPTLES